MAGVTPNYSIDYPTSTDLVRNGAVAMQTLATDVDTLLANQYLAIGTESVVSPGTPSTTSSTTFVAVTGNSANSVSIPLTKSGLAIVTLNFNAQHSSATGWIAAGLQFSGGYVEAISQAKSGVVGGTVQQSATRTYLIRAATVSTTAQLWWRVSGATGTMNSSVISYMSIG